MRTAARLIARKVNNNARPYDEKIMMEGALLEIALLPYVIDNKPAWRGACVKSKAERKLLALASRDAREATFQLLSMNLSTEVKSSWVLSM